MKIRSFVLWILVGTLMAAVLLACTAQQPHHLVNKITFADSALVERLHVLGVDGQELPSFPIVDSVVNVKVSNQLVVYKKKDGFLHLLSQDGVALPGYTPVKTYTDVLDYDFQVSNELVAFLDSSRGLHVLNRAGQPLIHVPEEIVRYSISNELIAYIVRQPHESRGLGDGYHRGALHVFKADGATRVELMNALNGVCDVQVSNQLIAYKTDCFDSGIINPFAHNNTLTVVRAIDSVPVPGAMDVPRVQEFAVSDHHASFVTSNPNQVSFIHSSGTVLAGSPIDLASDLTFLPVKNIILSERMAGMLTSLPPEQSGPDSLQLSAFDMDEETLTSLFRTPFGSGVHVSHYWLNQSFQVSQDQLAVRYTVEPLNRETEASLKVFSREGNVVFLVNNITQYSLSDRFIAYVGRSLRLSR